MCTIYFHTCSKGWFPWFEYAKKGCFGLRVGFWPELDEKKQKDKISQDTWEKLEKFRKIINPCYAPKGS